MLRFAERWNHVIEKRSGKMRHIEEKVFFTELLILVFIVSSSLAAAVPIKQDNPNGEVPSFVVIKKDSIDLAQILSEKTPKNLRAWHTSGQTFLVWEHSSLGAPETYEIYWSLYPITSISSATWTGEVFSDNGNNTRLFNYLPGARWKLPDGLGSTYTIEQNESYFVVTPHDAGNSYFAVVPYGGTIVGPENTIGPVAETIQPVGCQIQHKDTNVTVYAHWIDGRVDYNSGRTDYPVMGNEHSNGLGFNFAIWEPIAGRPPGKLPAVIWLHGGYGNLTELSALAPYMVPDGLLFTFDDPLQTWNALTNTTEFANTFWTGYTNVDGD
jgi:hypothetical protein